MPAVAVEATQPAVLVEPLGPLRRPDRTGLVWRRAFRITRGSGGAVAPRPA
jgi:hypothetical protein